MILLSTTTHTTRARDENWDGLYPDAEEDLPVNQPPPRGRMVRVTILLDADNARDKVSRRSVTSVTIFINNTPILTLTKRQKTVETSTYGYELVAARMAVEMALEVRYTLRMLGVPIEPTFHMYGDNMSMILKYYNLFIHAEVETS